MREPRRGTITPGSVVVGLCRLKHGKHLRFNVWLCVSATHQNCVPTVKKFT